jgi:AraC-like DNA-binding protein
MGSLCKRTGPSSRAGLLKRACFRGFAAEAGKESYLSREGARRLKAVRWYEDRGKNASRTARHFGLSRSTFHDWFQALSGRWCQRP